MTYPSFVFQNPQSSKLVEFMSFHFTTPELTMTPVTPPFADVLKSYIKHVVHEFYPGPVEYEQIENVINSYVSNLRRENTSETKIYELLEELNPLLGNPLTFYEEFVINYDKSYRKAARAHKMTKREAEMLAVRAMTTQINGSVTSLSS